MLNEEYLNKDIRTTSISMPYELWALARKNLIEFKTALTFGILFKIAEIEDINYPPNRLSEKIEALSEKLAFLSKKLELLNSQTTAMEKLERLNNPDLKKEIEQDFKEAGL